MRLAARCVMVAIALVLWSTSVQAQSAVSMIVTQCRVTVTAEPPDPTGWTAQFLRNETTSVGSSDASAPYTRSSTLNAGTYRFAVKWSKSGQTPRTVSLGSVSCPATPTVPPIAIDCVASAWTTWSATGEWSACVNGQQTRSEQRSRTVITPASNGGSLDACTPLVETRTTMQACTPLAVSAEGTTIPPATEIVDQELARWTIGPNQQLLRNGVYSVGQGSTLRWRVVNGTLTLSTLGTDGHWYSWQPAVKQWQRAGATEPGVPLPPPVSLPTCPSRTITLAWDDPGTATATNPAVTHYTVSVGTTPEVYPEVFTLGRVFTMSYPATRPGPHYFAVAAVGTTGVESVKSTVSCTVP